MLVIDTDVLCDFCRAKPGVRCSRRPSPTLPHDCRSRLAAEVRRQLAALPLEQQRYPRGLRTEAA